MATKKKNTDEQRIERAIEHNSRFTAWKMELQNKKIENASLEVRIDYLLTGLMMGVSEISLSKICYLRDDEIQKWLDANPENTEKLERARSYADAQLEYILQQEAMWDGRLAIRVLEKRNPDRWNKPNYKSFKKGVEKGLSMSGALGKKKKDFDIELD